MSLTLGFLFEGSTYPKSYPPKHIDDGLRELVLGNRETVSDNVKPSQYVGYGLYGDFGFAWSVHKTEKGCMLRYAGTTSRSLLGLMLHALGDAFSKTGKIPSRIDVTVDTKSIVNGGVGLTVLNIELVDIKGVLSESNN